MKELQRWRQLADAMIRGTATDSDAVELSELLRDDPVAQAEYLSYLKTHAALCWEFRDAAADGAGSPVVPRSSEGDPPVAARTRTWLPWAATVIAAIVAVAAWLPSNNFRNLFVSEKSDAETGARLPIDTPPADTDEQPVPLAWLVDQAGVVFAEGRGPSGVRFDRGDYQLLEALFIFALPTGPISSFRRRPNSRSRTNFALGCTRGACAGSFRPRHGGSRLRPAVLTSKMLERSSR